MKSELLRPLSLACVAMPLLLAACGGDGGGGDGAVTPGLGAALSASGELSSLEINKLGIVYALTDTPGEDRLDNDEHLSSVDARFERFASPLTGSDLSLLETSLHLPRGCTIEDATYDQYPEADYDVFYLEPATDLDISAIGRGEAISAGETLSFSTPAGSWPDLLPRAYFLSGLSYSLDRVLPFVDYEPSYISSLIPDGSMLDIPGDEFPAFAAIPVGGLAPVRGLSVEGDVDGELQAASVVRWTAGGDPNQNVRVSFNSDDPLVDEYKHIECITPDTGSFQVPAELQTLIGEFIFPVSIIGVTRLSSSFHVSGDALLLVRNQSSAFGVGDSSD